MPVLGQTPTRVNLNGTTPAAPAGFRNTTWQAGSPYPDPNDANYQVRDTSSYSPNLGAVDSRSTTTETIRDASLGMLVLLTAAGATAVTLDSAHVPAGFMCWVMSAGAGGATLTPSSGTIDGAANLSLTQHQGVVLFFDGTNWEAYGSGIATQAGIQNEIYTYAVDTGAANAYAIAPTPAIGAYAAGQGFAVKIATANTTASTIAVSGLATKAIKKWSSGSLVDLASGDLSVGQIIYVKYDGTVFQVLAGITTTGGGGLSYAADTGTANVYAAAPTPAFTSYTAGMAVAIKILNTNTGASTLNLNTLGTKNVKTYRNDILADPFSGDIAVNDVVVFIYDGTQFLIVSRLPQQPFDVLFSPNVVMGSGAIYDIAVFARTVVFPGNFAGSYGHCRVNPGSTQTINVNKNGSSIGTVSVSSGGVVTFTTTSGAAQTYNAGDYMTFTNQGGADTGMLIQTVLTGTR